MRKADPSMCVPRGAITPLAIHNGRLEIALIGFAACQELSGSSLLARLFLPACSAGIASKSFCLAVLARRGWWGWLTENCTAGRWARKPGRLSLLLGYTAQPVRLNLC